MPPGGVIVVGDGPGAEVTCPLRNGHTTWESWLLILLLLGACCHLSRGMPQGPHVGQDGPGEEEREHEDDF